MSPVPETIPLASVAPAPLAPLAPPAPHVGAPSIITSLGTLSVVVAWSSIALSLAGMLAAAVLICVAAWSGVVWPPALSSPPRPLPGRTPAMLSLLFSLCSLALAVYLMMAGIVARRGAPHGAIMLLRYARFKIPLVLLHSAVLIWLWPFPPSLIGFSVAHGSSSAQLFFNTFIPAVSALAYAVVLIAVLRRTQRREA